MKKIFPVSVLIIISYLLLACNSSNSAPLNPNGDSELAVLMREMEADALEMKKFIETGREPTEKYDHSNLFTATPTEDGKTDIPEYKTMAQSYLNAMKALESSNKDNALSQYTNLVDNCLSCHKSMCPGPVVRIEKLYVSQ